MFSRGVRVVGGVTIYVFVCWEGKVQLPAGPSLAPGPQACYDGILMGASLKWPPLFFMGEVLGSVA